jgi:hypothetical protein
MKGEIVGSVRIGNTVYKAGQEEEFAKVATADQITRLTEKGAIAGFGKSSAKVVDEAADTPDAEEAASQGGKAKKKA